MMAKKDVRKDAKAPAKVLTDSPTAYVKNAKGEWVQKTVKRKKRSGN